MRIDVLTTFPAMFDGPLDASIVGRARQRGLLDLRVHDLRTWTTDRHRSTDDAPYGGGAGMVMRPDPIAAALDELRGAGTRVIAMSAHGAPFDQAAARRLSELPHLLLLCGHYEGVDERVLEHMVDEELSIGDYVLTGGELPAMVVVDAVTRLLPGVLGSAESLYDESHSAGLLEYPHYTRPPEFRGWTVPDVLLSGNHAAIAAWRREQSLLRTLRRRPDLLAGAELGSADRRFLAANGAPEYLRTEDAEPPRRRRERRRADGPGAAER